MITRETPETFFEIWKQPVDLVPVILFYSPSRETCICLRHGGEDRYFSRLSFALSYAKEQGWLDADDDLKAEAEAEIRYLDRMEDRRQHEVLNASKLSRTITAMINGQDPDDDGPSRWRSLFPRSRRQND
ncbi:MAG: hypothetical protein IKQ69_07870 [Oscillospiraceae bacterium]|nr:hypothetical protein [Oscillospiraceae bacterium]